MADPARARKIADRIKVLVAETLEYRGGEAERAETAAALESAKGKLRSAVGKGIGIRLTPTLEFIPDALPEGAAHLEGLLLTAKQRDAEVAAAAAGATYAGDPDPYRTPVDEDLVEDDTPTSTDVTIAHGDGDDTTDDDHS